MKYLLTAALISLISLSFACTTTKLGEEFTLNYQESATISGDLTIQLVNVTDSRCPSDVQCIWAGEAKVTLDVTDRNANTATITLDQEKDRPPAGQHALGYTFSLVRVAPYPANGAITLSDYTATILVNLDDQ